MNKTYRYFRLASLACLTFLSTSKIFSQEKRILSFDQAIELGLNHSRQIQLDSLSLKIANVKTIQSKANQLPQVTASASYLRISDNITPLTVAFPTGNFVLNPQILNQSYNSIQARQVIWAGGKFKNSNKLAQLDSKAAELDIQISKSNINYDIATIYYNLYSAKQTKKILEANIELLTNQRNDAENFVAQGIILQNEALKIELALSDLKVNLSDVENTILFYKNNLTILTGLELNSDVDIADELPEIPNEESSLKDAVSEALKNRSEIKGLLVREQQANLSKKITNSSYFPVLSAMASYNYDQPNNRVFPSQNAFNGTWYAGVSLNWNLTDLFITKNKIRENKLLIDRTTTASSKLTEEIQMEVNMAFNNYKLAQKKIEIAKEAFIQASENFRVEQNKFNVNSSTATDFLNANTLLVNAKINLSTAISNAGLAYKKLLKSIN